LQFGQWAEIKGFYESYLHTVKNSFESVSKLWGHDVVQDGIDGRVGVEHETSKIKLKIKI